MTSSLDLNLLPLARQGGNSIDELPDLYAVTAPRKTARGREADSLIIYLSISGNSPLSAEARTQLMEQLAQKFYKTTGSLTSAMRSVVEELNLYLLDRNLRTTSMGRQGIGQLILAAIRADVLYMAQCGPVQVLLISPKETHHFYDLQSSGRGLGLSRTAPLRFQQVVMKPDDFLLLTTTHSPGWANDAPQYPDPVTLDELRRQVMENGSQDFSCVLVQPQAGTGKLRILKRKAEAPGMGYPTLAVQPGDTGREIPASLPGQASVAPQEDRRVGLTARTSLPEVPPTPSAGDRKLGLPPSTTTTAPLSIAPVGTPAAQAEDKLPLPPQSTAPIPAQVGSSSGETRSSPGEAVNPAEPTSKPPAPAQKSRKKRWLSQPLPLGKYFTSFRGSLAPIGAAFSRALKSALTTIGDALLRLLRNLLPDADVLHLPPSVMVFIALAIPLILATIGGVVYLQRGRAQQQAFYYQEAVDEAAYAATVTNPLEQRLVWQTVLGDLDTADYYAVTSQSQELRLKANENLDALDAIKRLDYKLAIVNGLESGVSVSRIVATATDLYLLDAKAGNVLHAVMTGRGYELDPNFQCSPSSGPVNVGPLVDIAELPPGSFENASILAMDASGNLLYCVIGSKPYSAAMAPPNTGFGEPAAMTLDRTDLFVLDPKVNAVWIYRNLEVTEQPRLFFGDTIPPMADVVDLAEYNDDLFLLHKDGHITKCTYSGLAESPTRCDDPYSYSDNRPGRVHGPFIEDVVFSQIYFSSFPERSIYMLDADNQAIYYFSVLLTLQWQDQPRGSVADGKATAFAVSPNRTAFLAVGNYVYYAAMP